MLFRDIGDRQDVLSAGIGDEEAQIFGHAEDSWVAASTYKDGHETYIREDDLELRHFVQELVEFRR